MKFLTISALTGASAGLNSDGVFSTSAYQAETAASKQESMWSKIIADTTSGSFPSTLGLAGIFLEPMAPTFDTVADAMPNTWGGFSSSFLESTRTKYIHSVGVVSKCKFVSTGDHPFTGIFEGADYGFCRLSSAAGPSSSQPLAPGLSLKFLRDGKPAADVVALYSVNGNPQGDWNFFSQDFRNHIAAATGAALTAVAAKFATYTNYIQEVGLSNYSDYNQ